MTAFLAPDPIQSTQFIPGGNTPAAGGLLFCYSAGSSSKLNTYTDATASTARTNPIVLDSGGNIPGNGEVWIASTAKFVLAPSNDTDPPVSPYWSRDNLPGVNDPSQVQSEWIPSGLSPTFVNGSTFILTGDQTSTFTANRRLRTINTGGTRYSIISSSVFSASTTIGIVSDTIGIDSGLSSVSYGILNALNQSIPGILKIGPLSDWDATEKVAYVDPANSFFGARNLPLLGVSETNYFQFLGHDDNNAAPNVAGLYAAFTDNHSSGTRTSAVGFEGDALLTGTGLLTGASGIVGVVFTYASSNATAINGVQGQNIVAGGTFANVEGVRSINQVAGGTITNLYSLRAFGPIITNAPTITNNYGIVIEYVGSSAANNWQFYTATSSNPVVIDNGGKVGIGTPTPITMLEVVGTAANYIVRVRDSSTGDRLRIKTQTAGSGIAIESVNSAENAFEPMGLFTSALSVNGTIRPTTATPGAYLSSDSSAGITTTVTAASLAGKTITIKDGIITGFA